MRERSQPTDTFISIRSCSYDGMWPRHTTSASTVAVLSEPRRPSRHEAVLVVVRRLRRRARLRRTGHIIEAPWISTLATVTDRWRARRLNNVSCWLGPAAASWRRAGAPSPLPPRADRSAFIMIRTGDTMSENIGQSQSGAIMAAPTLRLHGVCMHAVSHAHGSRQPPTQCQLRPQQAGTHRPSD
jgi:hypothetical protein